MPVGCIDAQCQVENKMWSTRTRSHTPQFFSCFFFLRATKQLKITTYTRFNTPFVRFCGFGMLLKNAFTGRKFITAFFPTCSLPLLLPNAFPIKQNAISLCVWEKLNDRKCGESGVQYWARPKRTVTRVNKNICGVNFVHVAQNVAKTLCLPNFKS